MSHDQTLVLFKHLSQTGTQALQWIDECASFQDMERHKIKPPDGNSGHLPHTNLKETAPDTMLTSDIQ
jgi:hypothetical protein